VKSEVVIQSHSLITRRVRGGGLRSSGNENPKFQGEKPRVFRSRKTQTIVGPTNLRRRMAGVWKLIEEHFEKM